MPETPKKSPAKRTIYPTGTHVTVTGGYNIGKTGVIQLPKGTTSSSDVLIDDTVYRIKHEFLTDSPGSDPKPEDDPLTAPAKKSITVL